MDNNIEPETPNFLNVQKFYETLARIIGDREGVEIRVVGIREKEAEETAKGA